MKTRFDHSKFILAVVSCLFFLAWGAFAQVPIPGKSIPKYVEPLPHFAGARVSGNNLTVSMHELQQKVLPAAFYAALPAPFNTGTYVWGYQIDNGMNAYGPLYPGFSVEATRGIPTTMTYVNSLPLNPMLQQYITVDQTLHWANPNGLAMDDPARMVPYTGPPPAVVHLHGGEVPSEFDGGPDQWFTPNGLHGLGYETLPGAAANEAIYEYPNDQEPTTLWFHDHTLGATRLNVYAGMAAFYLLRDATIERPDLPGGEDDTTVIDDSDPLNPREIPAEIEIAIQDRMFDTNGQLHFPNIGINPEHPFWIPEFHGDVMVVNGKTWPFLNVEPRRYRFRLLDGSNSRFYNVWLENMVTATPGPTFWQIGSDGGLLDNPANMPTLLMGPGERFDIIIDFAGFEGQTLTMRNNARSPYPKGPSADPQTVGQIMQFRVGNVISGPGGVDPSYNPATDGSPRVSPIAVPVNPASAVVKRQLTLNEVMGPGGPLEVLVNNTKWAGKRPDGTPLPGATPDGLGNYLTELPVLDTTEIWEIINLTADAHPIHLHLVQFQLLSRQNFNVNKYNKDYNMAFPGGVFNPAYGPPLDYFIPNADAAVGGNPPIGPRLQGMAMPPGPNEVGWKDTVIMYPGEVTRVAVRFSQQDGTPFSDVFDATSGPGYVWHCHIVDHEDNEMMRPYNCVAAAAAPPLVRENGVVPDIMASVDKPKFALLQNFPSPFNPDTWIPYQLAQDVDVNIKIYSAYGQLIKTLDLGNKPAGIYTTKESAAHWDGTNEAGEKVASGVYFYSIQAGDFTAIKKTVIAK